MRDPSRFRSETLEAGQERLDINACGLDLQGDSREGDVTTPGGDGADSAENSGRKSRLRSGFTTGTAVSAAAVAALRCMGSGIGPERIAVRLPDGAFIEVPVKESRFDGRTAMASVIKDAGDDPDVTNRAEFRVSVRCFALPKGFCESQGFCGDAQMASSCICCIGGEGVGVVTKQGLPVAVGEPAINPVPREMLSRNITDELLSWEPDRISGMRSAELWEPPSKPHILLPFTRPDERVSGLLLQVEVEVPRGAEIAKHTLNPRLGILGGISILGTTGIVKPFSNKAYEETIQAALSVAASSGCREVVLSTGGKSEHYARGLLPSLPEEAFVQVADFFAFSVREACRMGFVRLVHSVFFGKAVKMAQGHEYTHAHRVPLDLGPLARLASERGYEQDFCRSLAEANTARHAMDHLISRNAADIVCAIAREALEQSACIAGHGISVRLLLFDYSGRLLADLET